MILIIFIIIKGEREERDRREREDKKRVLREQKEIEKEDEKRKMKENELIMMHKQYMQYLFSSHNICPPLPSWGPPKHCTPMWRGGYHSPGP